MAQSHFAAPSPHTTPEADLSRLIHDLRSPLTALQLGLETLADAAPDADSREILTQLLAELGRLSARLNAAAPSSKRRTPRP